MDGEMDDRLQIGQIGHTMGLTGSVRRMREVLLTLPPTYCDETSAIMEEVCKMIVGFRMLSEICTADVVKRVEEAKTLRKEKQLLENKLEQLTSAMSSMVSGKPTVPKDASNVSFTTPIKSEEQIKNQSECRDGHVQLSLHLKCEEELVKRELQLAKLQEAYTGCVLDLQDSRKEVIRVKKNAEIQAARKETERLELVKSHKDEIADLQVEVVRLKEEAIQRRKEAGRLEEELGKATLKKEQYVELWKKESKQQDELRRQQKTLKGYLQLLASKFTSTQESEDLQFELQALECRGLDEDTTAYLKTILEWSFKPAKCSVGTQTMSNGVSQSSSSTQTCYSTVTEGTQTSGDCLSGGWVEPWCSLIEEPPLIEETNVLNPPWNLNCSPDGGEVKGPEDLDGEHDGVMPCPVSKEQLLRDKCLNHAGTKRPIDFIDLSGDSEDESEKRKPVLDRSTDSEVHGWKE